MKFSLKNMFWSTTLASLGAATCGALLRMDLDLHYPLVDFFLAIVLLLATGYLFGTAVSHLVCASEEET